MLSTLRDIILRLWAKEVIGGEQKAESDKKVHDTDCPATHVFTPFAVGYQTELGDAARTFVTALEAHRIWESKLCHCRV